MQGQCKTKQLSPIEATRLQNDEDAIFVDVREDNEFKRGHILGAKQTAGFY